MFHTYRRRSVQVTNAPARTVLPPAGAGTKLFTTEPDPVQLDHLIPRVRAGGAHVLPQSVR